MSRVRTSPRLFDPVLFFQQKSKGLPLPVTMFTHPHIHHQLNKSNHLLFTRSSIHSSSRYAMSLNHETQMNVNAGPHLPETPQGAFEEAVLSAVDKGALPEALASAPSTTSLGSDPTWADVDSTLAPFNLQSLDVGGEGDCQFRALAEALPAQDPPLTHARVRKDVADYLAVHPELRGWVDNVYTDAQYAQWVERMRTPGVWGDHLTLHAAAHVYGVTIDVVTNTPVPMRVGPFNDTAPRVILAFLPELHYRVTRPLGEDVTVMPFTKTLTLAETLYKIHVDKVIWAADISGAKAQTEARKRFEKFVKASHNNLANNGGVAGALAMKDIMRPLCLCLLQPKLTDTNPEFLELVERARVAFLNRHQGEDDEAELLEDFNNSLELCQNLDTFANKDSFFDGWKRMVTNVLMHVVPSMYDERDKTFHSNHDGVLREILKNANILSDELQKSPNFADDIGSIYELFRNNYGGNGGKELGQYFTPSATAKLMYVLNPFPMSASTTGGTMVLYDPCMGTAGLLTTFDKELRKAGHATNVRGTEFEPDTAKFACLALSLASERLPDNQHVRRSDTFMNVDEAQDVDFIPTNPPFIKGKLADCADIRKRFVQAYKDKHSADTDDTSASNLEKAARNLFKAMYPHLTGITAGMFLQHCVYRLAPNGSCAIVLPDGELFEGQNKRTCSLRKWLLETVNISRIVKLPGGVFPHTGIKTNIVYFRKDGKTRSVEYLQSNKECTRVTKLFDVPIATIEANEWSLDDRAYAESTQQGYTGGNATVPMVALGDVVTKVRSGKTNSTSISNTGEYPFYGCTAVVPTGTHQSYDFEGDTYFLFAKSGGNAKTPISSTLGIGKFHLVHGPSAGNVAIHQYVIRDSYKSQVTYHYLNSLFRCYLPNIQRLAHYTTGNGNINITKLHALRIPLPSLDHQQRIATELQGIFDHKATLEAAIEAAKYEQGLHRQFASHRECVPLFEGAPMVELGDVVNLQKGQHMPKRDYKEGTVPVVSSGRQPTGTHSVSNRPPNTICIAASGNYAGYVNRYTMPIWASHCITATTKDASKLNDNYVHRILQHYQKTIYESRPSNAGQSNIYIANIIHIRIPLPSLDNQASYVALMDKKEQAIAALDADIARLRERIAQCDELAQNLVAKACAEA